MNIQHIIVFVFIFTLSGCAAVYEKEFSCQESVPPAFCGSASDVYDASLSGDLPHQKKSQSTQSTPSASVSTQTKPVVLTANPQTQATSKAPIPIRKRPKIMRIYIAPWQDAKDRLMMPQFVFQEIESGKWNLGNKPREYFAPTVPASTANEK